MTESNELRSRLAQLTINTGDVQYEENDRSFLGKGSYGKVYRGRYRQQDVAVKNLHRIFFELAGQDGQDGVIAELTKECELLSCLRHDNIVRLYGVVNAGSPRMCMVTELMDGSLDKLYPASPPLTRCDELDIALSVSNALLYLHTYCPHPIIHRDLAPKNILYKEDGERYLVKLADVGLAKVVETSRLTSRVAGSVCPGTQSYMPPEALVTRGRPRYGPSLDVFSFSVSMVEVIVCNPPSVLPNQRAADLKEVGERGHPFHGLLKQCLSDNPSQRPAAGGLVDVLTRVRNQDWYSTMSCKRQAAHARCNESSEERPWRNEYFKMMEGFTAQLEEENRTLSVRAKLEPEACDLNPTQAQLKAENSDLRAKQAQLEGLLEQQAAEMATHQARTDELEKQLDEARRHTGELQSQIDEANVRRHEDQQKRAELEAELAILRLTVRAAGEEGTRAKYGEESATAAPVIRKRQNRLPPSNKEINGGQPIPLVSYTDHFSDDDQEKSVSAKHKVAWQQLPSLPFNVNQECASVVWHDQLYVAVPTKRSPFSGNSIQLCRLSHGFEIWQVLNVPTPPSNTTWPAALHVDAKRGRLLMKTTYLLNPPVYNGRDQLWVFDDCSSKWQFLSDVPNVSGSGTALQGDLIVAAGGAFHSRPTKCLTDTVKIYNMKTNKWSNWPSLPSCNVETRIAALQHKLLSLGGSRETRVMEIDQRYPVAWTEHSSSPVHARIAGVTVDEDLLFVAGGSNTKTDVLQRKCSMWSNMRHWCDLPPLPYARLCPSLSCLSNHLFAIGGCPPAVKLSDGKYEKDAYYLRL